MLENALRLCEANFGTLIARRGRALSSVAAMSVGRRIYAEISRRTRAMEPARACALGRVQWTEAAVFKLPTTEPPAMSPVSRPASRSRTRRCATVSLCRCSRKRADRRHRRSIARRFARSQINRSSWYRTSPPRPSSPSRTRGCSTNCASALRPQRIARAADRHVEGARGHFSRSPFDLQPVLETIGRKLSKLCEADTSVHFPLSRANYSVGVDLMACQRLSGSFFGAISDAARPRDGSRRAAIERRTFVCPGCAELILNITTVERCCSDQWLPDCPRVPMVRDDAGRRGDRYCQEDSQAFHRQTDSTLLKTFADQAVIAIENVRLFERSCDNSLAAADRHRRRAQDHQPLDL